MRVLGRNHTGVLPFRVLSAQRRNRARPFQEYASESPSPILGTELEIPMLDSPSWLNAFPKKS